LKNRWVFHLLRLVDQLTQSLPIVLMGLLALLTYWLVKSMPAQELSNDTDTPRSGPDYTMEHFTLRVFGQSGVIRHQIEGAGAQHFPDSAHLDIQNFKMRSVNTQGRISTASSDRAVISNGDSELELMGDAQIVRQAGSRLRPANLASKSAATKEEWPRLTYNGEYLHVNLDTEQARSHKPVLLTRGDDRFTADQMELDQVAHTIELSGRVRTILVPAKTLESPSPKPKKP